MSLEQKTRYYHSITDDFVESKDQDYRLPEDYKWVRRDIWSRFLSAVIYATAMFLSSTAVFSCMCGLKISKC